MQRRLFDRFGMATTSMTWRPDFAANLADGWMADGSIEPHDERSRVRAAGSMDTTIADFAKFAAGFMRGEGLKPQSRAEMLKGQLPIRPRRSSRRSGQTRRGPASGRGWRWVLVSSPSPGRRGRGFFKGGHNDSTANMWACIEAKRRCVVLLSNDVRAETAFPKLVDAILGNTGLPWLWEYPAAAP